MERKVVRDELKNQSLEALRDQISPKLSTYQSSDPDDKTVPFLEALFKFAPTVGGQHNIAVDILSCATTKCLWDLADRYRVGLIQPIRAAGGTTPQISHHPSRPDADFDAIFNSWALEPNKCSRHTMRELILRRENYRCAVNGRYDTGSLRARKISPAQGEVYTVVDTAHILPYSLIPKSENAVVLDKSGTSWQVICAFSGITLPELNGESINRPENGIALDCSIHREFGSLSLCFEPTDTPDTYKICCWGVAKELGLPERVSFVSRSGVPVPDPRYLALHAACAKVVHQCGMAEILDKLYDDLEQTSVLSGDGSSAHLLHHALTLISVR